MNTAKLATLTIATLMMAGVAHADHMGDKPCDKMHAGKPCPMMLHQQGHGAHAGHAKAGALKGDNGPSSQAYDHANMVMHQGMDIVFTGDADIDFLRGMIAHHQGAVDMAKVQLQYGKNAQVKKLSREIIRAQELEISWMKGWLAQLEGRPHTADTKTWIGEDSMLYK